MDLSSTEAVQSRETNVSEDNSSKEKRPTKTHTTTVCLVPPPDSKAVWDALTNVRTDLRDPGLFRWPPHVNILYPFLSLKKRNKDRNDEYLETLINITKKFEPFRVTLQDFGCFGNNRRGVLWLHPHCTSLATGEESDVLIRLQEELRCGFPMCHEQSKLGIFTPHMTLTHFPSLEEAENAKQEQELKWQPISFDVKEIYVLKRFSDHGQFLIYAVLPLGEDGTNKLLTFEENALKFPFMPEEELDWVYEERMKLKKRRKFRGGRNK